MVEIYILYPLLSTRNAQQTRETIKREPRLQKPTNPPRDARFFKLIQRPGRPHSINNIERIDANVSDLQLSWSGS